VTPRTRWARHGLLGQRRRPAASPSKKTRASLMVVERCCFIHLVPQPDSFAGARPMPRQLIGVCLGERDGTGGASLVFQSLRRGAGHRFPLGRFLEGGMSGVARSRRPVQAGTRQSDVTLKSRLFDWLAQCRAIPPQKRGPLDWISRPIFVTISFALRRHLGHDDLEAAEDDRLADHSFGGKERP